MLFGGVSWLSGRLDSDDFIETLDDKRKLLWRRPTELGGRLTGLHSISINLAYRITVEMEVREHEIVLVNVGTHEEAYR